MEALIEKMSILTDENGHLNIVLIVDKSLRLQALSHKNKIEQGTKQGLTIKDYRPKRSLDANAYMWVLCDEIAKKLRTTKEEVYRKYIKEVGVFEYLPIKTEAVQRFIQSWQGKGIGWIAEDEGDCKTAKGYRYVRAYYGSSTYDTKEMTRLIDLICQDCKELGIETLETKEMKSLLERWEDVKKK